MKVKIEIDCTPLEARQFFGLPDVQPMQAAILSEMEKRMMDEMGKFAPERLMQTWFSGGGQSADWFGKMMGAFRPPTEPVGEPLSDPTKGQRRED